MSTDIEKAKKKVKETYSALKPMVKEIVEKHSNYIDSIVNKIHDNFTTLTNKEIQDYMLQLQVEAYYFSERKDMALLMQECSIVTSKEAQASSFNSTVGTQTVRSNQAIIDSISEQVVTMLYNAVANSMKSKLDEVHRLINVLGSVLISRNAENKLKGAAVDENGVYNNSVSDNKPIPS